MGLGFGLGLGLGLGFGLGLGLGFALGFVLRSWVRVQKHLELRLLLLVHLGRPLRRMRRVERGLPRRAHLGDAREM